MRILFIGTVDFSRHCLEEVLRCGGNVVGVLTLAPDRTHYNADYADLQPVAAKYGVPVHHIQKINDPAVVQLIRSLQPDVMFVFGFSQLITKELLNVPPLGCIGVHPTLLPKNRGRHPLIWALVEGLSESGLTFFYMDEGADTGDILWQKAFPITLEDTAASLYSKIKVLASEAIPEFVSQLASGKAPRRPQDHSAANYWRKRGEKDGEINWALPTIKIYNLIRALTRPYFGAHTFLDGRKVLLWRAKTPKESQQPQVGSKPGSVVESPDGELAVNTGDGLIIISDWEVVGESLKIERGMTLG